MQQLCCTLFETDNAKLLGLTDALISHLVFPEDGFFSKACTDVGAKSQDWLILPKDKGGIRGCCRV